MENRAILARASKIALLIPMKLSLKAIAQAAKDPNFKGHPRDEVNRLIDLDGASVIVV